MIPSETLWPLKPHTLGKHLVLRGYLDAWLPILGTWTGRILFIDCFAGPGEYEGGEEGSPLIALRAFLDHTARSAIRAEVVFIFIEADAQRAAHLESLVDPIRPKLPANCRVEIINAPFDEAMTQILDSVDSDGSQLAPCFAMIDPFGVKGTPMEVMERLLSNSRSELYVSFMYEAMNRFGATEEFEAHMDALYGCQEWRDCLGEDGDARKRCLYELFRERLKAAGAEHVVYFDLFDGGRLVYGIFFATHHPTGCDRMKQAIWKVVPGGDYAFRGVRTDQLTLGVDTPNFGPLESALVEHFKDAGWVTIEEVLGYVSSDATDYHSSQVKRSVLAPMERGGRLEVDEDTRQRQRTYPAGTRLCFEQSEPGPE